MTLRLRNTLLILLSTVSAGAPILLARTLIVNDFNFIRFPLIQFIVIAVLAVFSTTTCIIIFLSFRNTASSEIFFFFIFIFSVIFDIFKLADTDLYGMSVTRIVYYGLFMGALSVFCAGLFTTGLEYQRMGIAAIIVFLLPAALVLILPVDTSSNVAGGTYEIGRFHEISIALLILHLMAVLNFIIAGLKNESREYLLIAAGLFIAVSGRALMYYFSGPVIIGIGFALLVSGTIIFALRIHRLYLWD